MFNLVFVMVYLTFQMEQHLIRIHRIVTKFVDPIVAVYTFERRMGNNAFSECVENAQYILFTLKILTELQVRN